MNFHISWVKASHMASQDCGGGGGVAPEGGQGVLGCRVSALQRAFKAQQVGKRDITQGLVSLGRQDWSSSELWGGQSVLTYF